MHRGLSGGQYRRSKREEALLGGQIGDARMPGQARHEGWTPVSTALGAGAVLGARPPNPKSGWQTHGRRYHQSQTASCRPGGGLRRLLGGPPPRCQSESTSKKDSHSPSWEEGWLCPRTATWRCGFTCRSSFKELTCPGPSWTDLIWFFIITQKSPLGQVQM